MMACGSRSRGAGRAGAAALHKISVFSFGEQKPAAPNTTKDGCAQNRRVVVCVLS
jgi:outer membrane protein OmpA-like peptidoglycan-associated protein